MKSKRHTTEDKIRILREANGGCSIGEICKEKNISEVTFHRWKSQFGQMDLNEARRLKALEKENTELKRCLRMSCWPSITELSPRRRVPALRPKMRLGG